jgi:uncharacterized protein (TIGR04141 family)
MPPKTRTLTIFLIKPGVDAPVHLDPGIRQVEVATGTRRLGTLYVDPLHTKPAGWAAFFAGTVADLNDLAFSSTSAGVFVTAHGQHEFAVTFGFGRHMLEPGC